jgi:hypothetical protein
MFHNGVESLIIINVKTLHKPVKSPADLVPLKSPVSLKIVSEDPLVDDNIGVMGMWNQVPSFVGHEGGVLFLHSLPPMKIGEGGWNWYQNGKERVAAM